MRWFKHLTSTRHNPKFRAVEKKFGEAGYARAFKLFEIIAERGFKDGHFNPTIDIRKPPTDLDWLAEEWKISSSDVAETLDFFAAISLINQKSWRRKIVEVPQMLEYRDEWTQRQQRARNLGKTPQQLPSDSGKSRSTAEEQKEAEVEAEKNTATAAASPLTGDCKKVLHEAWGALGIEPLGSIRFQDAWERFFGDTGENDRLSAVMERAIQDCQENGIKVPPPFFTSKRRIEARESNEESDQVSRVAGPRGVAAEYMR